MPPLTAQFARLAPVLRLTRVSSAFAAIANAWFVILWSRASEPERAVLVATGREPGPIGIDLLAGAGAAVGLYAFGACLNDVMDTTRDRAMRRDRPIAEGLISPTSAMIVGAFSLIVAVLGAVWFGQSAVVLTCVLALAVLGFNTLGKFIPGFGLVLLALIYTGHMIVPNIQLRFLWPVFLVMTHALLVSVIAHVVARRAPPLTPRAVFAALLGWAFWAAVLAGLASARSGDLDTSAETIEGIAPDSAGGVLDALWPDWVGRGGPVIISVLIVVFAVIVIRRIRKLGMGPRTAEKINRYGSLWLPVYACGWLFGAGHTGEGSIMAGLALLGFIGMSALREVYAAVEHPIGYRR
jgi:4-hydroxybenzoate polyprenyltransferase